MHKTLFFLLVIVVFGTVSCHKEAIDYANSFEKSQLALKDFKAANNNSYRYTVTAGTWVGASWETAISVKNGKVVERHFKYTNLDDKFIGMIPEAELEWTENNENLNTHEKGAATLTLDEVYALAKTEWLVKRSGVQTFFEAKNNGLISSCGYTEDGCQDDCFRGISISSITAL